MKKILLLSGTIVLATIANIDAKIMPGQEPGQVSIEEVQRRKIARQKELARKPIYKMLDALIVDQQGRIYVIKKNIDWPAVFHILDSMKDVISVNEYRSPDDLKYSLLDLAVYQNNLLATKTLLEKYKIDPDRDEFTPLMIACRGNNITIVNLLLKNGANPYKRDSFGMNSFDHASAHKNHTIVKLLDEFERMQMSSAAAAQK